MLTDATPFPVLAYSEAGQARLARLSRLFRGLAPLYGPVPRKNFEENPRTSPYRGAAYLGYKYYAAPHTQAQPGLASYFRNQDLDFRPDKDFIAERKLHISVGGDLMPYERLQPEATAGLWTEVADFFFGSDVVLANLETPLVSRRPPCLVPEVMTGDMHFNADPQLFSIFCGHGRYRYDALLTANNHAYDQGPEGLRQTVHFLRQQQVLPVGTFLSQKEKDTPQIIEKNGFRIGLLGYTAHLNKFVPGKNEAGLINYERLNRPAADLSGLREQARRCRQAGAEVLLLLLHAGNAYQAYPSAHTVELYHRIFRETGTDLILGSHPHNPQPMERYGFTDPFSGTAKQGFAIYSLSDFVAYDVFVWGRLAPLLRLTLEKGHRHGQPHTCLTGVQVLPAYLWGSKPGTGLRPQLRFFHLSQLLAALRNGHVPAGFTPTCVREARHLGWFYETLFLPENASALTAPFAV